MNILMQLMQSIRDKGVTHTARLVLAHAQDLAFDFKYKTETLRWHDLESLEVVGSNKDHGVYYQPTQARTLWKVFKTAGVAPEGAFLDLGCGKGRALILAAEFGYRRVLGVEFSELLCRIARENLARYSLRPRAAEFEVIHADAAGYAIPDEVGTVFLFNPFDAVIMAKVVENIEGSLRRHPRRLHIIYRHPLQRAAIDASGLFEVISRHSFAQCDFLVYRSVDRH